MDSTRVQRKPWIRVLRFLGGAALALVASFVALRVGLAWMAGNARDWCDGVAVELEAWRAVHGRYPATLHEADLLHSRPVLCREGLGYRAHDDWFYLDFSTGILSGWCYDSSKRTWTSY